MAAKSKRHVVVVDGSNLATEGRTLPSLRQLDEAVRAYAQEDPEAEIVVVVDASFEHRIDASERAQLVEAELHGEVVSPPAGAIGRGDAFVLRIAERTGARVLSNDSFQEFHAEHPWLFDDGRLVGGKPVPGIGWIFTPRLPVRGPKSRQVTGKARRAAETLSPPVKAAELAKAAKKAAARKVPPLPPGVTPKVGDVWTALAVGNGHEPPAADDGSSASPGGDAQGAPAGAGGKRTAKKVTAKKAAAEKPAAKKATAKKASSKKAAAGKAAAGKPAAKKAASKKAPAKGAPAAKATAKKAVKQAAATAGGASEAAAPLPPDAVGATAPDGSAAQGMQPEEAVAKRAASTKAAPVKKAPTKASAAKKASAKKAAAKASPVKQSPGKKTAAKKATATAPSPSAAGERAPRATAKASRSKRVAAVTSADEPDADDTGAVETGAVETGAGASPTRTARADPAVRVAIDEAMAEVLAPRPPATDGRDQKRSGSKKAKDHDAKEAGKSKRRRRRSGGPPPAVNEPLAFITFVAAYPLQTEVQGEVVSFTSHGAMVDVDLPGGGLLHCYIPLSAMGDPPPAKARQVLARGERRPFVLVGLDPPRRVAELALPEVPVPAAAAASGAGAS